jgi:hypothetical protein
MQKKKNNENSSNSREKSIDKLTKKESQKNLEKNSPQNIQDIEELQRRINELEKKASDLEKKNIYYYNIIKKNENLNSDNFNGVIDEFIEHKRYKNLNGYNEVMIDINDKIDEFIQEETIRDKAKVEYYETMKNLKNDIEYRLYFMKLLREKERLRDIERYKINQQFCVLKYDKNTGEVNPNRFNRYYLNNRYGNPYDTKSFNNINSMRPARINKNGITMNNQFISINQPTELKKYEIYDKFRNDYKTHVRNILLDTGSSFFDSKLNYKKYDINGKRLSLSSSCSNVLNY